MVDFIATPFAFGDIEKLKTAGAQSVLIAVPFFSARGAAGYQSGMCPLSNQHVCSGQPHFCGGGAGEAA